MIKVQGLTKFFDDYAALNGISCTIPPGCIYGMVGSNGAGKSTFLRLLTGVYRADAGSVEVDGEPVYENPLVKEKIAFVPDELFFLGGASLERMAQLYEGIYPDFSRERYQYLQQTFGLNPKKSLNTFSKGMRRQAAILLALASQPKYLFLDETFDGLDPVMRHLVKSLICEDVLERQATAILTSHSLRELEDTCDQLALLHQGGLVLESDIQDLKTNLFKIQVAFEHPYSEKLFAGIEILHFTKRGSVANLIVRGNREFVTAEVAALQPILLDVLPLTLEEVFTYEMEALGYTFDASGFAGCSEGQPELFKAGKEQRK